MSRKQKPYTEVRPGDIVTVVLHHYPSPDNTPFDVKVLTVTDRAPVSAPLMTYERLDGEKEAGVFADLTPMCDVSYVTAVVSRVPYKCEPATRTNVFANELRVVRAYRQGGIRIGHFNTLATEALASVKNVSLPYPLEESRAWQLWLRQGRPGSVILPVNLPSSVHFWFGPDPEAVRWKVFKKWVHRNATRLIETKTEAHRRIKAIHDEQDRALWETIGNDMNRYEEEQQERELEDNSDSCYFEDECRDYDFS